MNKRLLKLLVVAFPASLIFGCASTSDTMFVVDTDKVQQTEKAARGASSKVDVIWVNYPKKRVEKKQD